MLFELYLEFEDGRVETAIVPAEETKIYPQRDGIINSGCKPFKYKIPKHNILPKSIIRFAEKTMIFPGGIECHPKTTLDDIIEIQTEQQLQEETTIQKETPKEKREWKFESASGGGTYIVTENKNGTFRCNCPGVWRAKDRRCKHIKEVETY
jgi:hypothetical protein